MKSNLDELRELTGKLPPVPKLENISHGSGKYMQYDTDDGTCFGIGLWTDEFISVGRFFMSAGAKLKEHDHAEKEMIIVSSGCLISYSNGERKVVKQYDCIVFQEGVSHRVVALEDTWMIASTVPPSKAYPDARNTTTS